MATSTLIYDAFRDKIYAAVESDQEVIGNSIIVIDPSSGAIEKSIDVGSWPTDLAMSRDGGALYVGPTA